MTKQNTSPKQSSGGGYPFENETVAYFLAHLLARSTPFDDPLSGTVERIDTQRPATEWHLDDLLVTTRTHGRRHRLAFSIKSNPQITSSGFPVDFIRDVWEQLLHESSDVFDEARDYLCLITAPVSIDLKTAIFELLRLARDQDSDDLATQIHLPRRANDILRALHDSAQCPVDLATKHGVEQDTSAGRLLRRLLWIPFDLEDDGSVRRTQAIGLCQHLLHSGLADEARGLWGRLKEIADRLRRSGGSIDLPRLVDELRSWFHLRDFPDHVADWDRIEEDARSAMSHVRSTIGGKVTLPRAVDHQGVTEVFAGQRVAIFLGSSGTGKSAIAKGETERTMQRGKALWFDAERLSARTLAEWREHLGLVHPLGEIIRSVPNADGILVLDGIDRLYKDVGFATAAEFVQAANIGNPASPWRVLITCTPEEWGRVRESLVSNGVALGEGPPVTIGLPDPDELEAVWAAFPRLSALGSRIHLAPVLFRPKVLDLLATHSTAEDNLTLIGESHLARLFWGREVARGAHALARAEATRRVAVAFADSLRPDVSISALTTVAGPVDLAAVDELVEDRIFVSIDGRISFDHDLYADWVRVRQLQDVSEEGQLSAFLASRLGSPVWHRALRLYGVYLLEQASDTTPWTRAFEAVGSIPDPSGVLAQDILLEATAFTSARGVGLLGANLWPLLSKNGGQLLARLLKRLFHTATIVNTAVVDAVTREAPDLVIHVAAGSRLPYWPYWFGILAFLHSHRSEIPPRAQGLAARAADLWLRSTLPSWPFRKEAAAIAVALGDALLKSKEERDALFLDDEQDQQIYRAALAAGHEEPERVAQIVLEAAGRRSRRFAPPPLTEAELEKLAARRREIPFIEPLGYGPIPDPWPHGPASRVDGALQKAVLHTDALLSLVDSLPDVARETFLALLISEPEPHNFLRDDGIHVEYGLEHPNWYPPFYAQGPFRAFLARAEDLAVTSILQLVEHATDRWVEARARYLAQERQCSPDEIKAPIVAIEFEGEMREYIGDSRVYAWSFHHPDRSGIIGSALSSLEKHLYDRADAGDDLNPLIHRLLLESRSLSVVGLLGVFGCRHPKYLRGSLRGLLGSPHTLEWTPAGSVSSGWSMDLVPAPLRGEYRAWHEMPHRKRSLHEMAIFLFLNDPGSKAYFQEVRARLGAGLEPGGPYAGWNFIEHLIAQFDPGNYATSKDDNGASYLQYTPPAELRQKEAEADERMNVDMLLMALPLQCRQLLNRQEAIEAGVLDWLWEQARRVSALDPNSGNEMTPPANALAGTAAVIILRGEDWSKANPNRREWARRIVLDAAHEDRIEDHLYGVAVHWSRLAFVADALPALWSKCPADQEVRKAVARLALHGPPDTAASLASGVALIRSHLPDDHKRLLRALLLRAGVRSSLISAKRFNSEEEDESGQVQETAMVNSRLESVERALVEGTLETAVPSLEEIAPLQPITESGSSRRARRRQIPRRTIDEALVIAAYRGIPNPSAGEESPWLEIWEKAVSDSLAPFAHSAAEPFIDQGTPDTWDRYIMERSADIVANMSDPVVARRLWQPIIDLGTSAEEWVVLFARRLSNYAFYPAAPEHIVVSWTDMIDAALANPRWAGGSGDTYHDHRIGEIWRALFGFVHSSADVLTEELRPRIRTLEPQLTAWAGAHLTDPDNARAFAHLLILPAAADVVLSGLVWLHDAALVADRRFWGRKGRVGTDDSILTLLAHVWNSARGELRQNGAAFAAFRGLLERLASRQYAPAFELADRVGASR